jgi:competence protein ComEC
MHPINPLLKLSLILAVLALVTQAFGQTLRIYHIDVEQAAATLFVSPSGKTLLIDAGKNGHGLRIKNVMQQAGVTRIDHFVNTHYHEDHYGGIDELAGDPAVTIDKVYDRGEKDELPEEDLNEDGFKFYQNTVGNRAHHLTRGETIPLDNSMTVTCVASGGVVLGETNPLPGDSENDKSIALYIQFGNFRCFIGGDIEITTEGKIAARDLVLDVDLYQANHHGSHTSSSVPFMEDLRPTVVVISNGNNARYAHPRLHTLNTFATLTPRPKVFQTNKYLKGGLGGNVADEFVADLESADADGTILTTVNGATGSFTVSYTDASHVFPTKTRGAAEALVVIDSVLPDPAAPEADRTDERITVRNKGAVVVSLTGWLLRDRDELAWSLESLGTLAAGESKTIRRNGMALSLNNDGDEISLFGPGNQLRDRFQYAASQPGVSISTGH